MSLEMVDWKSFENRRRREPGMVVDLRNRACFQAEHVPGAISLPFSEWDRWRPSFPKCAPVYLYCDRGNAALAAGRELSKEGYQAVAVMGGYPKPCDFD